MRAARQRFAHIDGLRAVAILGVVGYHVGLPGFRGGFVGVDVFFVISGFLITGLIVDRLDAGTFSKRNQLARPAAIELLKSQAERHRNVKFIDPFAAFCESGVCRPYGAEAILYRDQSHLSDPGSVRLFRSFPDEVAWMFGSSAREPR
jgi:hypothetical protein